MNKLRQAEITGGAILCFLFLVLPLQAQTYLYNRSDFPTGKTPFAVISADFNKDGLLDLAVVNRDDNSVSILIGKPGGTFAPQVVYTTGTAPVALVAADFNGDGKLDLAVANSNPGGPGSVSILLGNGDGTFQGQTEFAAGANPVGIAAADYNGDSKVDLAVANNTDSTVSILMGNGDGTFQGQTAVSVGTTPVDLVGGDFNGDGKMDLATSDSGSDSVTVLISKGDGTFSRTDSPAGGTPSGIAFGDFNKDGKLDLVVALPSTNPSVLLGNGDGSFQLPNFIGLTLIGSSVVAGDFDNDGNLDLAFAQVISPTQEFVAIMRGRGDGTFQEFSSSTAPASARSLFVADFNGDGRPDLVATAFYTNNISVLLGKGDCTFDSSTNFSLTPSQFAGPLIVADFNGDGKPDVAWSLGYGPTDTITTMLGDGKGGLGSPVVTTLSAFAPTMAAGDFNGDGRMDLATGYFYSNSITFLPGSGDGTFGASINTTLPTNVTAGQVVAGDVNGDGKAELIVNSTNSTTGQSSLTVYTLQSGGTFVSGPDIFSSSDQIFGALADVNGDGKLDLIYTLRIGATVNIALGNGDGTFKTPLSFATASPVNGPPFVADLNGDGKPDLVVPVNVGFSVLLGNGDGTFQNQTYTQVTAGAAPGHLVVADFNGDGKPDIAGDFPFSVLLGNGDGTFQAPRGYAAGGGSIGLSAADFNSDGVSDLVFGNRVGVAPANVDLFLSTPLPSLFPASVDIGTGTVGVSSSPEDVTLMNIGNAPLSISSVAASGDFAESNTCTGPLDVLASCTASVVFTPTGAGLRSGTLTFVDSVVGSPQVIALMGTGTGPGGSLSPTSLSFTAQLSNSTSAAQTVTLSNSGNAVLTITSIAASGDFAETNTCGSSVAVGANCTISVTFTPTAGGSRTGALTITDNAANSPQTVPLTGTGEDFSIAAASGSTTSASVSAGQTATYNLTLTSAGGLSGTVSLTCTGAPAKSNCTVSPTSVTTSGATPNNISVSVSTTAPSLTSPWFRMSPPAGKETLPLLRWPLWLALFAGVILASIRKRWSTKMPSRAARIVRMTWAMALLGLLVLMASCGGGSSPAPSNPGTVPGTYNLTLTGTLTSGGTTLTRNLILTLTVH